MAAGTVVSNAIFVTIGDVAIDGLLQATISSSNCFSADSFSLTFAMGPPPLGDIVFWSSLPSAYVVVASGDQSIMGPVTVITGMIDAMTIDPILATVSIEGRDLSATLIDGYRQQDFVNQTASEIVATIAQNHGLAAAVTPTTGNVGRYYADNYTRLSLGQFSKLRSDWDLIVQLARENSFDAFVEGQTLFFQPAATSAPISRVLQPGDVTTMRLDRVLSIDDSPAIRVQSWNSQNMASYVSDGTAGTAGAGQSTGDGNSQSYLFSQSNLTSQQVSESAIQYAAEVSRLRTVLHLEIPWDLTITPRTQVYLDGTNSTLDGLYRVENVDRHFSSISGSTQQVRASFNLLGA